MGNVNKIYKKSSELGNKGKHKQNAKQSGVKLPLCSCCCSLTNSL